MREIFLIVLSYLIGSIPTSVWVSRYFFEIDIRDYGSGNAGATNTYRILGKKWGTFVMIVDMLKGIIGTSLYIFIPFYLTNELERTNFMIGFLSGPISRAARVLQPSLGWPLPFSLWWRFVVSAFSCWFCISHVSFL